MKQLSKEQAIAFSKSKIYENWTDEQIVRFQLFQRLLCMPFGRFHEAMEKVLNRPIYTHEFGIRGHLEKEYLGVKLAPTFGEIIDLIPEDKRAIIKL